LIASLSLMSSIGFIGCEDDEMINPQPQQSVGRSVFAVDAGNNLIRFGAKSFVQQLLEEVKNFGQGKDLDDDGAIAVAKFCLN